MLVRIAQWKIAALFQNFRPQTVFMGLPTAVSDLQGNEAGVTPTIQVDIFISSQWNISKAYEIDEASHTELKSMGFDRIYGPEIMQNISPSIKRLSSRYTRNVGYGDSL